MEIISMFCCCLSKKNSSTINKKNIAEQYNRTHSFRQPTNMQFQDRYSSLGFLNFFLPQKVNIISHAVFKTNLISYKKLWWLT